MKKEEKVDDGQVESENDPLTIPEFITSVLNKARDQKDADAELLDILENQIVHAGPLLGSPLLALKDIESLAEKRSKEDDGG